MQKRLVSFLLAFVMVVTLVLPSSARATELDETFSENEFTQTEGMETLESNGEGTMENNPSLEQVTGANTESTDVEDVISLQQPGQTRGDDLLTTTESLVEDKDKQDSDFSETVDAVDAELPGTNESMENAIGNAPADEIAAAAASVAYPQMTGYYLVSVSGSVMTADGQFQKVTEKYNMTTQKNMRTTNFETQTEFTTSKPVILTFYHEGIGVSGQYIKPGPGYFAVNGSGYGSVVDGNRNVLAYYADTTISDIDSTITELTLTSSMKEQRESASHVQKEWTRTIKIHFYNDREDGPDNVYFELNPDNSEQYILRNVNSTMEYRIGYAQKWTPCTNDEMTFDVPAQRTYYQVRYKATADSSESNHTDVYLPGRRSAPAISINWVDESFNIPSITTGLEYSYADSEYTPADSLLANGATELLDQTPEPGPVYLRFRYAANEEAPVSSITSIKLYPRGPVPENITINPNTYVASGVSSSLQYFVEGDTSWRSISSTTLNLREFAKSDKEVMVKFRTKATSSTCLSKPLTLALPRLATAPNTLVVNFADETVTGFQAGMSYQYRINTGTWSNVTLSNQAFSIKNLIVTSGDRILSIRGIGTDAQQATDAWQVTLPKRIAAPTTCVFTYNNAAYPGKAVLTGVSPEMEYQVKGATSWTSLSSTQQVFDLPTSGTTYYFRIKSTASSFASLNRTVTLYAPAAAPTNALNMTTEKITVSATMEYCINNGVYTKLPSGETTLLATDYINALSGSNTTKISLRYAATETKPASKEKVITLVARRAAPTTVTYSASNMYINGATTSMQYREVGATSWTNVSKSSFSIEKLLNGRTNVVLEFRYKPTTSAVGSYTQSVNCF